MITLHKFGSSLVVLTVLSKYTWKKDTKKILRTEVQLPSTRGVFFSGSTIKIHEV